MIIHLMILDMHIEVAEKLPTNLWTGLPETRTINKLYDKTVNENDAKKQ